MHPSLRILAVLVLASVIQFASLRTLGIIAVLLLMPALYAHRALLGVMLYRSRWLLLTMLLIYAFTTPGEYLPAWDAALAPTYEGIAQGVLQAGRLVVMLAALALLMGTTRREQLLAGIYPLIRPLRLLGIAPERFTARLWLTLHYAEQVPRPAANTFWQRFEGIEDAQEQALEHISIPMQPLNMLDKGVVGAALATIVGWWLA